ncbi:hypothetical protein BAUCODRAFT_28878 [Baudoinia panamericana UAMH 10762]|uniref:Uncharacterized protein n=1 Tax=Baudoinia panamericana (strain UAMH 10762) TaxID=717646 RepID=M2M0L4_BAUPA|nr:uncharacterized protein BAUCODRAFT_28878 [Baudoinia panamericana UAMH 10762]EMD00533.1 hypothetical protein BAUCODRAFT_28878 [Baudoinia panamericana UAMH 10762]
MLAREDQQSQLFDACFVKVYHSSFASLLGDEKHNMTMTLNMYHAATPIALAVGFESNEGEYEPTVEVTMVRTHA